MFPVAGRWWPRGISAFMFGNPRLFTKESSMADAKVKFSGMSQEELTKLYRDMDDMEIDAAIETLEQIKCERAEKSGKNK